MEAQEIKRCKGKFFSKKGEFSLAWGLESLKYFCGN